MIEDETPIVDDAAETAPQPISAQPGEVPIVKGATFQTLQGTVTVSTIAGDKVIYNLTGEDGIKRSRGPISRTQFQAMVVTPVAQPTRTTMLEVTEKRPAYDVSAQWARSLLTSDCNPWRRRRNELLATAHARLNRWALIVAVAGAIWGIYCLRYYQAAGEAREKLDWIYQEGVKDPAVKSLLERVDKQRAEYYESLKDDEQ